MARYLTINSKFNPITFEERIKPLLLYKEEYEKQEEALNKMLEDSQSLASLANSPQDSAIYRQYQDYQSSLNGLVDNLTNNGKLDSRAALQLRRQYLQNLKPYESKLARRNELIREQAKNYTPDTIYDKDYSSISLNDIDDSSTYRTYKLGDISTKAAKELYSKYTTTGTVGSELDEVNEILSGIDTEGLSEDNLTAIRNAIKVGRGTANMTYNEYLDAQTDKELKRKYTEAQINHLGRTSNGSTQTNSYQYVTTKSGNRYKVTKKKDGKYYNEFGQEVNIEDLDDITAKSPTRQGNKYAGLAGTFELDEGKIYTSSDKVSEDKMVITNTAEFETALNKYPEARDILRQKLGDTKGEIDTGLLDNDYTITIFNNVDGQTRVKITKNQPASTTQQQDEQETSSNIDVPPVRR